jgi:hypothetical protein
MGKVRPDFRSNRQKREHAKVTVSAPSAGFSYNFGWAGQTWRQVDFSLDIKLTPSQLPNAATTTSPILDFAVGETSYEECFETLPVKEEDPKSMQVGIKTHRKERNLNSVSALSRDYQTP